MKRSLSLFAALALFAGSAWALELHAARANGQVGEKNDGYVQALDKKDLQVQSLVSKVNAERKAEYSKIAVQNGESVENVGKVAANKIISNLSAGESYQDASGKWVKK